MLDFLRDYLIEFYSYSPEEVPIVFALLFGLLFGIIFGMCLSSFFDILSSFHLRKRVRFLENFILNNSTESTSPYFRQRRLKKRVDKSSKELCDYVDKYIERKESEGEKYVTSTDLL